MEEKYTNREIDAYHRGVETKLDEILEQTTQTNGKVAEIQRWRERVTGATGVVVLILVPILGWGLWQLTKIDEKVQNGMSAELSKYEIELQ